MISDIMRFLLLVNGIFIKPKETVHFDFAENNAKSVTRCAATFIQYKVIISLIVNIFLSNLAYNLRLCWIILTQIIVCVGRLCAEL